MKEKSRYCGVDRSGMPIIGIQYQLANGQLFLLDAPGLPIKTQWRLVWLKNKKLSPVGEAFLKHLREHKQQIITKYFDWYAAYGVGR